MKIGIGIPTYNRLESLKVLVQQLEQFCDLPYDLFISVDGSTDGTKEWLDEKKIEYNWHENAGIAHTRNYIVDRFKDYDNFFIIEDDVRISKAGVFGLYVRAKELFGIHHFNFLTPYQRKPSSVKQLEDLNVMYSILLGGCFSSYTKEVVQKVGYFNPAFKGYGHEHCEYTLRVSRVGLTTGWNHFAHLTNAESYIEHDETVPKQCDPALTLGVNGGILFQTMNDDKIVYINWSPQ